jgi:hypothetical protein
MPKSLKLNMRASRRTKIAEIKHAGVTPESDFGAFQSHFRLVGKTRFISVFGI